MARAADVIFFVLIAGGAMGVVRASGAVDAIVAVALVYVASGIGYAASAHNPFTVLIAQGIAGLELNSGWAWRWLLWAVAIALGIRHVIRYAARVRADPGRSLMAGVPRDAQAPAPSRNVELRGRHVALLAALVATVAAFVWGTAALEWGFGELSAAFLGLALVAAAIGRLGPSSAAGEFGRGAAEMTSTVLLIGFARSIQVILEEARVIDTVVDALGRPLAGAGPDAAALGMLGFQGAVNLLVPSGSAQANVTMPLMAPLADVSGVTRQCAVLAFQMGDGLTNMVIPTNAVLMAVLAIARVPYERWLRFVAPLIAQLAVLFAVALVAANRWGLS
jgi:uncharacterized ion transporter superfamily protein YfcC